jgi:hypothetical protein
VYPSWNRSKTNVSSSPLCCHTIGAHGSTSIDIEFLMPDDDAQAKKFRKIFPIFLAAFKKSVFLQP